MVLVNVLEKFRGNRSKRMGDPDGVMATLQGARRLLVERGDKGLYPVLDGAVEIAVPKDRARAWWSAHRALINALPSGYRTMGDYLMMSGTTHDDVLAVFDRAIAVQASANAYQAKGPRPKIKGVDK